MRRPASFAMRRPASLALRAISRPTPLRLIVTAVAAIKPAAAAPSATFAWVLMPRERRFDFDRALVRPPCPIRMIDWGNMLITPDSTVRPVLAPAVRLRLRRTPPAAVARVVTLTVVVRRRLRLAPVPA